MKNSIHPAYFEEAQVVCSCGNTFVTGSTKQEIRVEICFKCHPLYTGEKRFVDTLGQVGKFQEKQKVAEAHKKSVAQRKEKNDEKKQRQAKSLRDLLMEV